MSKIKIKNFGPIKDGYQDNDGWIEIKKVTVFIGNQGSGKSTVAKLISTFSWIEKALVRGDYNKKWFERKNKLKNQYLNYHRLENYFKVNGIDHSVIEYKGEAFNINYENGSLYIEEVNDTSYQLPQIMYVPAERNFITYVKTPKELKLSSDSLKEFLTEFDNAKNDLKGLLRLPINNTEVEYDKLNDTLNLKGEGFKVKLTEASSGFQSLVPLYLVSHHLAHSVKKQSDSDKEPMSSEEMQRFKKGVEDIWSNDNLTDEQKRIALSVLSSKFNKTAFINIVEEPEQNLFPSSQQKMLFSLLEFNNINKGNKLIITTHSPYLINCLSLSVKANFIKNRIINDTDLEKLNDIVPGKSTLNGDELAIYELHEKDGSITKLETQNGLPSDANELNEQLDESNELFAQLLEIQQGI
ncbi:AAA family ATPase [Arundinibacter roseus]|uniref:ATP-binding protein n=1 Tax=Arundinibacter roseus TaxID=2070510 RepID=A0A4R4KH58_9BACT|nr:AAA family ATPase [Arundinibacter roseus]TDB67338.1 ATP-binding protein [Arundinibacter roseus]